MTSDPRTLITEDQLRRMLTGPTSGGHAKELAAAVFAQESVYSTGTEQPTCAERIADQMAGRAETIKQLQKADDDCDFEYSGPDDGLHWWTCLTHTGGMALGEGDTLPIVSCDKWRTDEDGNALGDGSEYSARETADERLAEMPLSVEVIRHVKILLGTGGPADWLDAELDDTGYGIRMLTYHFSDWFDHASAPVFADSPLWTFAESFVEWAVES
jgi:hypothetical protein